MIAEFKLYRRRSIPTRSTEPTITEVNIQISDGDPIKAIDSLTAMLATVRAKYAAGRDPEPSDDEDDEEEEPFVQVRRPKI